MTRVNVGLWPGTHYKSAVDFKLACMEATIQRTMDGKQPNRSLNRSANRVRDL
jgi:hypothetical protein